MPVARLARRLSEKLEGVNCGLQRDSSVKAGTAFAVDVPPNETYQNTMRLPAPLARREVLRMPLALAAVLVAPFPSLPAHAISATTMSGKSKPELGMILVDAPKQEKGGSISAEAVLPSGKVASISWLGLGLGLGLGSA